MLKSNSINEEILKYFLLFSIFILIILWLLQFIFFNAFYKDQKINDIKTVSTKLKLYKNKNNYPEIVNTLAFENSVCIEIDNADYDTKRDACDRIGGGEIVHHAVCKVAR